MLLSLVGLEGLQLGQVHQATRIRPVELSFVGMVSVRVPAVMVWAVKV
jgi:hypothetical protein